MELRLEFEQRETAEAKFTASLDRLMAFILGKGCKTVPLTALMSMRLIILIMQDSRNNCFLAPFYTQVNYLLF